MKYFLLLSVGPVLLNCTVEKNKAKPGVQQPASPATASTAINYDSCKNVIRLIKQQQKPLWAKSPVSVKEKIFTRKEPMQAGYWTGVNTKCWER